MAGAVSPPRGPFGPLYGHHANAHQLPRAFPTASTCASLGPPPGPWAQAPAAAGGSRAPAPRGPSPASGSGEHTPAAFPSLGPGAGVLTRPPPEPWGASVGPACSTSPPRHLLTRGTRMGTEAIGRATHAGRPSAQTRGPRPSFRGTWTGTAQDQLHPLAPEGIGCSRFFLTSMKNDLRSPLSPSLPLNLGGSVTESPGCCSDSFTGHSLPMSYVSSDTLCVSP